MTNDADYQTNAAVLGGLTNGMADPALISKALHQGTTMVVALAQIVASSGVNVSDADVNVLASQILSVFAQLNSPAFSGTPTAPTAAPGTNSQQLATTGFVNASFAPLNSPDLIGSPTAPTPAVGDNSQTIATTAFVDEIAGATSIGSIVYGYKNIGGAL